MMRQNAHGRQNEHGRQKGYFVPGEGISREVIQANICRYLGNDALVRPGNFEGRRGYFIVAYRNLTPEMIAELKEESTRWEAERKRQDDADREREGVSYQPRFYPGSSYHAPYRYPPLPPTSAQYMTGPSPHVIYGAGGGSVPERAPRPPGTALTHRRYEAIKQEENEQQSTVPQDSVEEGKQTTPRQSPDPTGGEARNSPEGDISKEDQTSASSEQAERETDTTKQNPSDVDGLARPASNGQDLLEIKAESDSHSSHSDIPNVPSSSQSPEQAHGVAPPLKGTTLNTPKRRGTVLELNSPNPNRFLDKLETTRAANTIGAASDEIPHDTATPVIHLDNRLEKRSLNLVCYRSAVNGCTAHQIHVVRPQKSAQITEESLQTILSQRPDLISTDVEFLQALKDGYEKVLCSFWRRNFSLKTLRSLRLRSYRTSENTRPVIVDIDPLSMQDLLHCYHHPSAIATKQQQVQGKTDNNAYIHWVFALKGEDTRYLLEFVEGWSGQRIAVAASIPMLLSTLVGVLLSSLLMDVQSSFTVAGFILTMGTVFLALVGILSGTE